MRATPNDLAEPVVRGYDEILVSVMGSHAPEDRTTLYRAALEAQSAWPGAESAQWSKWIVEAGRSVGLRVMTFDCTVKDALKLALQGGALLTRPDGDTDTWFHVSGTKGRRFIVQDPHGERPTQKRSARRFAADLGLANADTKHRFLVIEDPTRASGHHVNGATMSPLSRLTTLLRPEAGDLWIVIIFALVAGVLSLATPIAVEALVNTVAFGKFLQPVVILSLILFAFLAFGAAMRALQTFVVEIVQRRVFARVVSDLAYRLPRVQRESLDGKHAPELVNRFFDVVTVQKVTAQLLLDGVAVVVSTFVGMSLLAFYHPWLLGFDVVLLGLIAFTIFVLGRGAIASSVKESKVKYRMASWLEDVARCPTTFAHEGAAEGAARRADELTLEYLTARKAHFRILMRQIVFALAMNAFAGTVLMGLGGWLVISGQLTLGQLVAAELVVAIVVGSFAKLGKHMESFYDLLASVDKLGNLFDLPVEHTDGVMVIPYDAPARVRARGLSYGYGKGSALSSLDFAIEPGEIVGLRRSSGWGKTTLAEILFGLRDASKGHVEMDGVDPRDVRPDVLRRHVALAGEPEVFVGTIAENVQLDRPHVGTIDVREALRSVGLLDEMLNLPDGVKTKLTQSGAPLSSGQLRRLILARALAGQPRLLVVDGLLDALDDGEIDEVFAAFEGVRENTTVLVLTTRRSVTGRCQRELLPEQPAPLGTASRLDVPELSRIREVTP